MDEPLREKPSVHSRDFVGTEWYQSPFVLRHPPDIHMAPVQVPEIASHVCGICPIARTRAAAQASEQILLAYPVNRGLITR